MGKRVVVAVLVVGLLLTLPIAASGAYPNYDFVETWSASPGEPDGPAGIEEGPYGEIFVVSYLSDNVQVFDADGTPLRSFGTYGSGPGQLDSPWGLDVTDDGIVYIADYDNDRISIWDTSGNYLRAFGTFGTGNGELDGPSDVAVGADGLLYVAEDDNDRIQVFEPDGTYVRKWGGSGTADGQFDSPYMLEFDSMGRLWVADYNNHRLQYFTAEGTFLGKMGNGTAGSADGQFDHPADVKFDPHGNMYVADEYNDRVQMFAPNGTFITKFGTYGTGDGQFDDCEGVQPTSERYVVASDYQNDRVQRFFSAVPTDEEPIAGANRFLTATAASKAAYPAGLMEDSEGYKTVVIATGRNWPDALGGSTLAGVLDAPILLVDTDALPAAVSAEITRLGATRAIVLGGEMAVSANVASAIDALPGVTKVERIGGVNRYLTAEQVAKRATDLQGADFDNVAFVATGENFPDSLACSPIAAANGWPLYLVPASGLRDSTKTAMTDDGIVDAYILGGTAAVSADAENQLNALLGDADVNRIEGETRYETAVEIAWFGQDAANMNWTYTALATGLDFPDALTGGPLQGRDRSIMLLTKGTSGLPSFVSGAIEDHKNAIWTMRYLGGTAVVPQTTRDQIADLLY